MQLMPERNSQESPSRSSDSYNTNIFRDRYKSMCTDKAGHSFRCIDAAHYYDTPPR